MIYGITGQSGFIGQALTNRLIADGHQVFAIPRYKLFTKLELARFLRQTKIEEIFHLAAYGNHSHQKSEQSTINANINNALNLFKAADGRKVYNFSTSAVTLQKQTLYSITKFAAEQIANMFNNVVNIRPYSVYGIGEADHRFIPTVIASLIKGTPMPLALSATHDWIYIDCFINALLNGHTEIGTGIKRTNVEVVHKLEEISGKKLNFTANSLRGYDNADWVCKSPVPCSVSIEEGLLKCWIHYKKKYE